MPALDDEARSMLSSLLRRFVAEHCDPVARLHRLRHRPVNHRAKWPALAELGLPSLLADTELGGMAAGAADLALVAESLAPGLLLEPLTEALLGATMLAQVGHPQAGAALAGELLAVPVGLADTAGLAVDATGPGKPRLNGRCCVAVGVREADLLLVPVAAADGAHALAGFAPVSPGIHLGSYRLMDGRSAADLRFDDAPAAAWFTGAEVGAAIERVRELWLCACVADALGVMQALITTTAEYLRTRVQFGVTIGSFQALQHRLADMHVAALQLRGLLRAWTRLVDEGGPPERHHDLRRASLRLVRSAGRRIGHEAIQMHGGMGLTEELWVSHGNARLQATISLLSPALSAAQLSTPQAARPASPLAAR